MTGTMKAMFGFAAALTVAANSQAGIAASLLGSGAYAGQIGPLTSAPADPSPLFPNVSSAPLGGGKNVLFSSPLSHRVIGAGWASWSHGYTGDVYYTNGLTSITLTFDQADLSGFVFYVESNPFGPFTATITANGVGPLGASSIGASQPGDGNGGAVGFGISTDLGTKITSITISMASDFAVGEFKWAKSPAPGALALLGVAGLCGRRRRA